MVARSEAPADPRPYVRVSTDLPTHPKLEAIDNPAAGWAYVVSLCYCAQSMTDGHFPLKGVARIANVDQSISMALTDQGLWHLPGHDCDDCDQPRAGHAVIHDYLQHQRSAAEVRELTDKRREAGRKGAEKRWAKTKAKGRTPQAKTSAIANAMAPAMANGQADLWQTDGKPIAEERRGEIQTPTVSAGTAPPPTATPLNAPTLTQRSKRITDAYAEAEPMCNWPAINGVVLKAVKSGRFADDEVQAAVLRMAKDGRSVTVDGLRTELSGFAPRNSQGRRDGGMASTSPRRLQNSHDNPDRYDVKL